MKEPKQDEWFYDAGFWNEFAPIMFDEKRWAEVPAVADGISRFSGFGEKHARGARVADLCCGMGRISNELARRGFAVTGVDITGSYLEAAAEDAAAEFLNVEYIQQDIRYFMRDNFFDLALSLYISFGYFDNPGDDFVFLENIFRSLRAGGMFIVELLGKEIVARDFIEGEAFERGGFVVVTEYTILGKWEQLQNTWTISNERQRAQKVFTQRLYAATELEELFRKAGFSSVESYGDWDGSPYNEYARVLIVTGRK